MKARIPFLVWLGTIVIFIATSYAYHSPTGLYTPIQNLIFLIDLPLSLLTFLVFIFILILPFLKKQKRHFTVSSLLKALLSIFLLAIWTIIIFSLGERSYALRHPNQISVASNGMDTIAYINGLRSIQHLMPLKENTTLDKIAKQRACDMVNKHYFAHEDPEGRMPWHLFIENGYNYSFAGENLAEGYVGDNDAMQRLLNSPEHRDNILSPNYTEIGIGYCGQFYVQEFGQPI